MKGRIPYNLPTGKTVFLTADQVLNMDDLGIQNLVADDVGSYIDDAFFDLNVSMREDETYILIDEVEYEDIDLDLTDDE